MEAEEHHIYSRVHFTAGSFLCVLRTCCEGEWVFARGTLRAPLSLYGKKQACVVGGCSICFCFMSVFSFTPRLLFHYFLFLLNFLLLASVMPFSFLPYHFYFTSFFKKILKTNKVSLFFPPKKKKEERRKKKKIGLGFGIFG